MWAKMSTRTSCVESPNGELEEDKKNPYFYRVRVDQLRLHACGGWRTEQIAADVSALFDRATEGKEGTYWRSPDGRPWKARRLKSTAGHYLSLSARDGVNVTTSVTTGEHRKAPRLYFVFPAAWCREAELGDAARRARQLAWSLGFDVTFLYPARLDLCCDVPLTIDDLCQGQFTGYHRSGRGLGMQPFAEGGRLTGYSNKVPYEEGSKPRSHLACCMTIYSKKLLESKRGSDFWERIWAENGIPPNVPITRVEGRLFRRGLRKKGISRCQDLTQENLTAVWHWFTTSYLRITIGSRWRPKTACNWTAVQGAQVSTGKRRS